jgi:hypothetical protein
VGSPCWWLVDLATYKKYLHRACGNSFSLRYLESGKRGRRDLPYTLCRLSRQQTAGRGSRVLPTYRLLYVREGVAVGGIIR